MKRKKPWRVDEEAEVANTHYKSMEDNKQAGEKKA